MSDPNHADISRLQEKLSVCMRMVQDAVVVFDAELLQVVEANPAACKLFGIREKQFIAKPAALLFNDFAGFRKAIRRSTGFLGGKECIKGDGRVFTADLGISYLPGETHGQAMVFFWHIIDEEQAEREKRWREALVLERMHTESAFFLGEEHERKRLARDLHGHLGPMMFAVKMGLEQLLSRGRTYISRRQLRSILSQHTETIKASRLMTSRLSEAFLPEEDINEAIRALVQKFHDPGLLSVYCKADRIPEDVSHTFRYHLMQILEEGLTNIVKHAEASRVSIRLRVDRQHLDLYILDNGQGAAGHFLKPGRGLHMLEQRAALIGGKIRVETTANMFFKLSFSGPIYPQNDKSYNPSG